MAVEGKAKKMAPKSKGQSSITSFMKGTKSKDAATSEEDGSDEETHNQSKSAKFSGLDASELPPINNIPSIFADIVSNVPKIQNVASHLNGRKLRVATMCSGTESPLLALDLICRSIKEQYDVRLEVEHVFSCEIEPFKQAYIERNFQPPILFRDVCELGGDEATTAYGALAQVPGDADLLVAGTSCVDYSNLNNEKQGIEAEGESGRTFRGMMAWVEKHRPPIVILENVCSAPWDKIVAYFEKRGYSAAHTRFDTKNYYIPHTRTRGYLIAVDQKRSSIPQQWLDMMPNMRRPASSPLDAFLLPSDDPRIHQAREKLVRESYNGPDRRTGRIDWGRCESRHQRARVEEGLGSKRPLTSWDEGGSCKVPDFSWGDWATGQVERVWDLMDISLLRSAIKGVDPSYKSQVWNLSQNVDRSTSSSRAGICPCLTPSMIPYITNRGGPMVGLEALSFQGLPIDELLLTRETEDNLADLAGNAMSTTVVGSCILAAVILSKDLLGQLPQGASSPKSTSGESDEMEVDGKEATESGVVEIADHISGESELVVHPLNLAAAKLASISEILTAADRSSRLCNCEGRKTITDRVVQRCQDCGSSACVKCGGRPEHNMTPITFIDGTNSRLPPSAFEKTLKSTLPMCLTVSNITEELLEKLWKENTPEDHMEDDKLEKLWSKWRDAVIEASSSEFRFIEARRQDVWLVVYDSTMGSLELSLHPKQPEWRFYAKAAPTESVNSTIRKLLESGPVGRFVCSKEGFDQPKAAGGLLEGRWDFALPLNTHVKVSIDGIESISEDIPSLVPAWEQKLGLTGEEFRDRVVYAQLQVSIADEDRSAFDRDISGVYTLHDKCGTANCGLHKKDVQEGEEELPPVYLMLDPSRFGDPKEDSFLFSISNRRYEFGESRPVICRLDSNWRQQTPLERKDKKVDCSIPFKWVKTGNIQLQPSHNKEASFAAPGDKFHIDGSANGCESAKAVLVCRIPLENQIGPEWPRDGWREVDKVHELGTYKALAWLLERIRTVDELFADWQTVTPADVSHHHHHHLNERCERCAPTPPSIQWRKVGKKVAALEDPVGAGEYERNLKRRPAPFVTQLKLEDEGGMGTVRIGINIPSLLHRALSRLPVIKGNGRMEKKPIISWRLHTDFTPAAKIVFPKFNLLSNKTDEEHSQPPNFKLSLRPEQLRSLHWMLKQENDAQPFFEEEISEAVMAPLGWRAEGRAQREVLIKGGVLADQVGYGKTAITLGLLDCTQNRIAKQLRAKEKEGEMKGKIAVKASLVIVPPHLTGQWASEVEKFTGDEFEVVVLSTATSLNSLTIKKVQKADLVIVASNLFSSTVYLDNLQTISGGGSLPTQDGRYFGARLDQVLDDLKSQVEVLRDDGATDLMKAIKAGRRKHDDEENNVFVPTKRLKGKAYRQYLYGKREDAKVEIVTKALSSAKVSDEPSTAKKNFKVKASSPSSQFMDAVVVPRRKSAKSVNSDDETKSSAKSGEESDDVKSKKRRAAAKKVAIVISDDEDEEKSSDFQAEEEEEEPTKPQRSRAGASKRKAPAAKSSRPKKKSKQSSDSDQEFSAENSPSEEEEDEASAVETSEDEQPKKKAKTKVASKPKLAAKRKASSGSSDMDVDESEPTTKKGGKKRKTEDEDKPAKKQKRREDTDPWKLESSSVKKDWTEMRSPPLEMFHFARKVVDEYTYLDKKNHALVTRLTADRHWVLSGTPPTHDFAALKTIAAFMNVHLGVDDDGEGKAVVKKRQREQTTAERFHSFREVHTLEWHAHRHQVGQTFLDRFVRQNIAEIDEIPLTEHFEKIELPAAERAIYLELEHHLRALDMVIKRGKKNESDREKRLAQSLGDSSTAEEALLKRCSHFDLDTQDKENAMKACEVIVEERKKQLEQCRGEFKSKIKKALEAEKGLPRTGDETLFREFIRITRDEGLGDQEATKKALKVFDELGIVGSTKSTKAKDAGSKTKSKAKDDSKVSAKDKDLLWQHREETHEIRKLAKELTARVRSLRYFTVVRDLQKQKDEPMEISCPSCKLEKVPIEEISVLSSCGHMGCHACVVACAEREECVYAASGQCKAAARVLNVVRGITLGVDDEARDGRGKHYGLKLEKVIELIKKKLPKKERVLVFVQFPDLMKKVAEALSAHSIKYLEIKGSASVKSKNLLKFQDSSDERVLLLNVMDESASGANLTVANHAVFLSPLLAPSQEIYDACEIQAIGRLRRYGQSKHVHVWRFLSMNTIDVEILEQRSGKKV